MALSLQDKWNIATVFIVLFILAVLYVAYIRFMNRRELRQNFMCINNNDYDSQYMVDSNNNFHNYINGLTYYDDEENQIFPVNNSTLNNINETTRGDNERRLLHILIEMGFPNEICEEAVEESSNLEEALDYCEAKMKSSDKQHDVVAVASSSQSNSIFVLYNPYDAIKISKIAQNRQNGGYEMINRSEQVLNPINNIDEYSALDEEFSTAAAAEVN